jgi:osmoprotectant transport system ATP-binding protein
VTVDDLVLGGSLAGPDASLRTALDAALSSPSGRGVAVDGESKVIGTVAARDVLAAIEKSRGAGGEPPSPQVSPAEPVDPFRKAGAAT